MTNKMNKITTCNHKIIIIICFNFCNEPEKMSFHQQNRGRMCNLTRWKCAN